MVTMEHPPDEVVRLAVQAAQLSPCAKSKRGVIAWLPERPGLRPLMRVLGEGHNAPPIGYRCDGSAKCRASCGKVCEHAVLVPDTMGNGDDHRVGDIIKDRYSDRRIGS